MSEAKMTGRKVNKPDCATVRNQVTALFSLPMRLGQHVPGQSTWSGLVVKRFQTGKSLNVVVYQSEFSELGKV